MNFTLHESLKIVGYLIEFRYSYMPIFWNYSFKYIPILNVNFVTNLPFCKQMQFINFTLHIGLIDLRACKEQLLTNITALYREYFKTFAAITSMRITKMLENFLIQIFEIRKEYYLSFLNLDIKYVKKNPFNLISISDLEDNILKDYDIEEAFFNINTDYEYDIEEDSTKKYIKQKCTSVFLYNSYNLEETFKFDLNIKIENDSNIELLFNTNKNIFTSIKSFNNVVNLDLFNESKYESHILPIFSIGEILLESVNIYQADTYLDDFLNLKNFEINQYINMLNPRINIQIIKDLNLFDVLLLKNAKFENIFQKFYIIEKNNAQCNTVLNSILEEELLPLVDDYSGYDYDDYDTFEFGYDNDYSDNSSSEENDTVKDVSNFIKSNGQLFFNTSKL
jgi:hypothetical protein